MIDNTGKVAVIFGVANKRSIAYSIAEKLGNAGSTLVLCYQSERLKAESEELIESLGQTGRARAIQCDVSRDEEIDAAFAQIAETFPAIHTIVHSVAIRTGRRDQKRLHRNQARGLCVSPSTSASTL